MRKLSITTLLLALLTWSGGVAAQRQLTVQTKKMGAPIQPTMYGIFFEDINFGADGGLYAEMVINRSFEFPQTLMGWNSFGNVTVSDVRPAFDRNPHYVVLGDSGHIEKRTGLENRGFFGMGIKKGLRYDFSVYARKHVASSANARIRVELVDSRNEIVARQRITVSSGDWQKYTASLEPKVTDGKALMRVFLETAEGVDMDHVSLFPSDNWHGLRADLVKDLEDLHPGIFRFPGGCIVEGTDLETRYQWKNSVGQVENRPLNENRWEYTFAHRLYPDYFQSYGLGFFEFFQLSEDIGAEPLPIVSCGLACQFQNNDINAHVPVDRLNPYIQDALDLIEFANGPATSTWGKVRADMGHPEPFNLKYIGIGNEQWDTLYPERLEPFIKAIRKAYPAIKIVGSAGPNSEGDQFDYLWPEMRRLGADLVDEHFYRPYDWFLSQGTRYDNYDRKGPKVFAGEYACHASGRKYNHYYASLLEAAFMTGLERNADIVHMATYAPLFAHVEGWQWRPDLIWYDNLHSFRTVSWYVQQLYSLYKRDNVVGLTMNGKPVAGQDGQNGLFASAVREGNQIYIKVANTSDQEQQLTLQFNGLKKKAVVEALKRIDLSSDKLYEDNSIDAPVNIVPVENRFDGEGQSIQTAINPLSFSVFVLTIE